MCRSDQYHGQTLYEKGNFVHEYVPVKKKDGTYGKRLKDECRKYSPLFTCECCGLTHGKKRVRSTFTWADPAGERGEGGYKGRVFNYLCLRCLFTLEAARRKWLAYDQLRLEANRIRRKLDESTKDNARTA